MTANTTTPELTIVDGHYPSFKEIAGLPFEVSVVMFATDLSLADEAARTEAMERICKTWNAHDDLVKALEESLDHIFDGTNPDIVARLEQVLHRSKARGA